MTTSSSSKVWLITGAGRGLGRAYVLAALAAGHRVVATVRDERALDDIAINTADTLRVLVLDVSDRAAVVRVVAEAVEAFGRVDVVVNNAGYGLVGAVEEVSEADVRALLDVNLLGALWVTQAVLPTLRAQGSGHIVQISSVGGVGAMPFLGMYNASKWALEGFSDALAAEVEGFGIRVTIVEPGGFATDWGRGSMRFSRDHDAYDDVREAAIGTRHSPWPMSDDAGDEGDPAAAAAALLAHVEADAGPRRLLIGADAPPQAAAALEQRRIGYVGNAGFIWPGADPKR